MKLSNLIQEDLMSFDLAAEDKDSVMKELVELVTGSALVRYKELLLEDVVKREKLVTTGVGWGVAFPHAKTRAMKGIVIAFGRSVKGIPFEAMDGKAVNLFFLIAAPEDTIGAHLNVMARLSFLMKSPQNRERLNAARNPAEVMEVLDSVD